MKTLVIGAALLFANIAVHSQVVSSTSTVTVNATGNRNKQIIVDNTAYSIGNTSSTGVSEIEIANLTPGQHTLQLERNNAASTKSSKTYFTVRDGYNLKINVSSNGSVSTAETRVATQGNANTRPITTAQFNKVYSQTKAKKSSNARETFLENQFNSSSRTLTARQASQLIQLVNSENSRLKLAKLSYSHVSDPQNFSVVTNLLNSTANRTALNDYISTTSSAYIDDEATAGAMTDTRFRTIYNEVYSEPSGTDRTYYLNNFFGRDANFYTSAQAKQLIQLVPAEQDRFAVAKAAYRGITDRENYYNTVYPLLSSSSNRSALQTYVNSYNNNNGTAMTSANFENLYQSVYNSNNATTRYNTIYNAFTTNGNYFTVAQAKRLIPLVSGEANRLQLAKTVYGSLSDRENYLQFNDFLSTTASRNDFRNYVLNYGAGGTNAGVAMSTTEYDNLYQNVKDAWTSSSRAQLVLDAFNKTANYFTTYQVRQLLSLVSSESDRLSLAKSAYDNIVDVNNYYSQLYDLFNSTASRTDLANFASNMQNGTSSSVKVAMPESSFNDLKSQIQLTFGFGAKYSSLTEIFNTETNYFTVAQVKELIQQVSSERNRIELSKLAYNNVVDPENFNQLYDIISSQSGKNEVAAYVSANASN
jgi:hypothetical protein